MNNYDYPLGSDTPDAPWNQSELDEREFDVCISQTLSKSTSVITNDYIPSIDETEDGSFPYADTSETNWKEAYIDEHYTPLELIETLKSLMEDIIDNKGDLRSGYDEKPCRCLIKECSDWIEDETEVIEE